MNSCYQDFVSWKAGRDLVSGKGTATFRGSHLAPAFDETKGSGDMCRDCEVLHERLQELSHELFQLKRANTKLKGDLRHERQEKAKLLKEKKQTQHYRNEEKRGRNGRHG